jgi:trimeric autotransporter adhesin
VSIKCDSFECISYVPNIISGSEINNGFAVFSKNMTFASLEIFDRWGNKMFYTNDPLLSWNSRAPSGKYVVPGVYVYLIRGVCNDGKPYFKYGDVTVVR